MQDITEGVLDDIQNTEKKLRIIPLSKRYCYHLSSCLEAWMNGEKFDKVMQYVNADEGELIRYFRMAIQILREIPETPVSLEVKQNAKKALRLINREIIDGEKQLRR